VFTRLTSLDVITTFRFQRGLTTVVLWFSSDRERGHAHQVGSGRRQERDLEAPVMAMRLPGCPSTDIAPLFPGPRHHLWRDPPSKRGGRERHAQSDPIGTSTATAISIRRLLARESPRDDWVAIRITTMAMAATVATPISPARRSDRSSNRRLHAAPRPVPSSSENNVTVSEYTGCRAAARTAAAPTLRSA